MEILRIRPARPEDMAEVRLLMRDYVDWIAMDLAFQEIDAELDGLPGEYAPPGGTMLVASEGGRLVGVVALRAWDITICEMKRLYVRPEARGRGLAKQLIERLVEDARRMGYSEMRLDTLPMMGAAQALYEALGFVDIDPYYDTPIEGTRFMSRQI